MKSHSFFRIAAIVLVLMLLISGVSFAESEITYPTLNKSQEFDIPDTEAMRFVRSLRVGWNLGNTFDAWNDGVKPQDHMNLERYWCGIITPEAAIAALKEAGFNTLRLPVSWHNHVDEEFNISTDWLDRVQEVADYAISRDMYVIINIHHDTHLKFYYPDEEHYEQSERYMTAIWTQVAQRFADYDEHLIFEAINEPRLAGTSLEWSYNKYNPDSIASLDCIMRLNQVFVNTVRAAGGNNAQRYLMVPGYAANPDSAVSEQFAMPEDTAEDKLILSVHAYTPYSFALQAGADTKFEFKNVGLTSQIYHFMDSLYNKFIKNGVPVVIGEFGARDKNGNLQDRVNFTSYYMFNATLRGITCCWWDNHVFGGNGEIFGILDRRTATWKYPEIVEAMMLYAPAAE